MAAVQLLPSHREGAEMKHLVYCILRAGGIAPEVCPVGVNKEAIRLLAAGGLAAAFSIVCEGRAVWNLEQAKAYADAVEALHEVCPVLPVRYGCLLPSEESLVALLHERRDEFIASLGDVEGCVEMGIRIMLEAPVPLQAGISQSPAAPQPSSGASYLADRRRHYAQPDGLSVERSVLSEELPGAFRGLFVKHRSEYRPLLCNVTSSRPMLSFYFLVKRARQDAFRDAFRAMTLRAPRKMLLSGPWPPYNFAGPGL